MAHGNAAGCTAGELRVAHRLPSEEGQCIGEVELARLNDREQLLARNIQGLVDGVIESEHFAQRVQFGCFNLATETVPSLQILQNLRCVSRLCNHLTVGAASHHHAAKVIEHMRKKCGAIHIGRNNRLRP